jgi:streptogramin lyase
MAGRTEQLDPARRVILKRPSKGEPLMFDIVHDRSRHLLAALTLAVLVVTPAPARARLKAFRPAFAVSHAGSTFLAVSLTGTGFGAPGAGSFVLVRGVAGTTFVSLLVPSQDPSVVVWDDEYVVVKVQPDLLRVHVGVQTPDRRSALVPADHYDFASFDTSVALGQHTAPHHIALDAQGRVWINSEFHIGVAYFDPTAGIVQPAFWPRLPVPAFKTCLGSCVATTLSGGGEDATTDSKGRVWLPEGGGGDISPRNHSRIIGYDPQHQQVLVFNLPGDQNGLTGIAWDATRNRLWFTQTALSGVRDGILTSFDPDNPAIPRETFAWDFATLPACTGGVCSDNPGRSCSTFRDCMVGTFDFTTAATCSSGSCSNAPYHACQSVDDCVLADSICPPAVSDDSACYHDYPSGDFQPAHLVVNPRDGSVWWANYFLGSDLARLDPSTGQVTRYPLAPPPFSPAQLTVNNIGELVSALVRLVNWPWDIAVTTNGDIVATEYSSNRIARFRGSRAADPACNQLAPPPGSSVSCVISPIGSTYPQTIQLPDPSCVNPCITESLLSDSWAEDASSPPFTHSRVTSLLVLDADRKQNLWFGQGVFVRGKKNFALLPPLLALYPSSFGSPASLHSGLGGGMLVNRATGEIWATDFSGLRLNRLVKVP